MQLTVNGEARELNGALTHLDQVIDALGHHPRLVVVEFNGAILPRGCWGEQPVAAGDRLEVVTIVGGG